MSGTHILSALKQRRDELSREMRTLATTVAHLDATIRLFESGAPPRPKQRQLSRGVLGLLRDSGPMTAKELAEKLDAPVKRVMGTLCYQRDRGRVRGSKVLGQEIAWDVVR